MWQKVAKFKGAEYFRKALYVGIWNFELPQDSQETLTI